MRLCTPCGDKLKDALKERGLWKYVSEHGYEAAAKAKGQVEGKPRKETFDPFSDACMLIYGNAMNAGGLEMLQPPEEGKEELCPVCHLKVPEWIGYAADGMKKEAEKLESGKSE